MGAPKLGRTMTQHDLEAVRRAWDAWEAGDMAALFEFYAPDVEWDMTGSWVADMGVYAGHDGIRSFFRQFREPFEDYWAHAEEFVDLGDRVVVRVRQGGRGKGSGVDIEMPSYWQVYTLRDGKAVRVEVVRTAEDAFGTGAPDQAPRR